MKTHCYYCGSRLAHGKCSDCAAYTQALKSSNLIQGVDGRLSSKRHKSTIACKKCDSLYTVKSGIVRGKQRYHCNDCDHYFTISSHIVQKPASEVSA